MSTQISVIAPVYNEKESLREFYTQVSKVLQSAARDYEIVFVDDGSSDGSDEILRQLRQKDSRVRMLQFSRNFGHQIAVKAGIDHAGGEALIIMDADLQDPPGAIPDLIGKWKEGYDVVYARRAKRDGESYFKKWTAAFFYRLLKRISSVDIPIDTGDFRLISRPVADVIRNIREKNPYIRGLVSWVGFRQTGIFINRPARFAGETKYSLKRMFHLAFSGILHFSFAPLRFSLYTGTAVVLACLGWFLCAGYRFFILKTLFSGTSVLLAALLFLGGVQLIAIGILGSYLARNYDESRPRPLYVLRAKEGF